MVAATPQSDPISSTPPEVPSASATELLTVLADTHVHVYPRYDPELFLDQAAEHLAKHCAAQPTAERSVGCLMMTELPTHDFFARLKRGSPVGNWSVQDTEEDCSVWLEHTGHGQRLLVMAGRQVASFEGVELLTLCSTAVVEGGRPLPDMIDAGLGEGAVCVLPWGVGKWLGRRGGIVADMYQRYQSRGLLLSDNAGRPIWMREPALFQIARGHGSPVLRGSDPLNTRRGEGAAGSYGTALRLEIDPATPAANLREALFTPGYQQDFGQRTSTPGFLVDQLGLRWRKHVSKH